jgi:hypothetical protein
MVMFVIEFLADKIPTFVIRAQRRLFRGAERALAG